MLSAVTERLILVYCRWTSTSYSVVLYTVMMYEFVLLLMTNIYFLQIDELYSVTRYYCKIIFLFCQAHVKQGWGWEHRR